MYSCGGLCIAVEGYVLLWMSLYSCLVLCIAGRAMYGCRGLCIAV